MRLARLLSKWYPTGDSPCGEAAIKELVIDSRQVREGDVFCALAPQPEIRKAHIHQALEKKAACVLVDGKHANGDRQEARVISVPDLAAQLDVLAKTRYGAPSIPLFAVTGTNGKTSVAWMGARLFSELGLRCGYIGTLGAELDQRQWSTQHTTPDLFTLYRLIASMQQAGAEACFLEASSHALAQGRLAGLSFKLGVFTNLSQDHLDYHGDMQTYRAAKWSLWLQCETLIGNSDDPHNVDLPREPPRLNYGSDERADLELCDYKSIPKGIEWTVAWRGEKFSLRAPLAGRLMLDNLLAIHACALTLGYSQQAIKTALRSLCAPPGRMEMVHRQPKVIVDYAHSPDALERLLLSLGEMRGDRQRLGLVFGCGGNRDAGKRPLMGDIAARLADRVFITSDNPRDESPRAIADAIIAGVKPALLDKLDCELDRKKAIYLALDWCKPNDCLAIAGKGHETTQEIADVKLPCNDSRLVREYFDHAG